MVFRTSINITRRCSKPSFALELRVSSLPSLISRALTTYDERGHPQGSSQLKWQSAILQLNGYRSYVTRPASRPKAHTGRTTTTPRKKAAAIAEGVKSKRSAIGRPAVKHNAGTKLETKPKAKLKTKPRIKAKAKPKPKPKSKVKKIKKVLTEEEAKRKLVRDLRRGAMKAPRGKPYTIMQLLVHDISKTEKLAIGDVGKQASKKLKTLRPEEIEQYNHTVNQNKAENARVYKTFIESLTSEQIRTANRARSRLTSLGIKGYRIKLKDERRIKKPSSPWIYFNIDRHASGDLRGLPIGDSSRLVSKEWKELPEAEKQKYIQMSDQAKALYAQELSKGETAEAPATMTVVGAA